MDLQKIENVGINHAVGKLCTLKEVNEWNRQFWSDLSDSIERWMADPEVLKLAMEDIESESVRRVPLYNQKSFAQALERAANTKTGILKGAAKSFQIDFSKKGGSAPKPSALQKLILEIVQRKQSITEPELLRELETRKLQGIITDIDYGLNLIEFQNNNDQQLKRASISGLKDRLSRAKKKLAQKESR
ncbi:MAG TPA: hypothetical protein VFR24_10280 [Candidatus Angelobacter sp.]|nr:hypothetical protein [Candidatus Angelobacter sp.]